MHNCHFPKTRVIALLLTLGQSNPPSSAAIVQHAAKTESLLFSGTIKTYRVWMVLKMTGDKVSGYYGCERNPETMKLTGSVDNTSNISLVETDDRGTQTGSFKGKVAATGITGTWSKPDGKAALPFDLSPVRKPFEGDWDDSQKSDATSFSLMLKQRGSTVTGYHIYVFSHGRKTDAIIQERGDNISPSITGVVDGDVAKIKYQSTFNEDGVLGTAEILWRGDKLMWKQTLRSDAERFPERVTLKRSKGTGGR